MSPDAATLKDATLANEWQDIIELIGPNTDADEITRKLTALYEQAYEVGWDDCEMETDEAYCKTADEHESYITDDIGMSLGELADMETRADALTQFVTDAINLGVQTALQRLPVAVLWSCS